MVVVLWQNWGEHVGRQLPHFLSGATLTDVTITVGPRSIRAHRIVLAFFSSFFKKMLEEVNEERPMVLVFPGVNFDALQLIVAYMYRGQVSVPVKLLTHVVELAKMLRVKGLIELPAQLDSVIFSSGKKNAVKKEAFESSNEESVVGLEAEGLVELEVTASDLEPPVCPSPPAPLTPPSTVILKQQHQQQDQQHQQHQQHHQQQQQEPESHTELLSEDQGDNMKAVSCSEEAVLMQPQDLQLSTVEHLTAAPMVKLREDGMVGEVLFGGDYVQGQQASTSSSAPHHCAAPQEGQEYPAHKKRKKNVYKLTRYGPEALQRAIEDVRSGMGTLREIAERWSIPLSTLCVNAKMAGISVQQRNLDYDQTALEAAKQAVRAGNSYMKVAREYNIPKSVLWRRCQRERVLREEPRRHNRYSPTDLCQARQLLLARSSLTHIVKETKIPKTTLFRLKEQLVREGKLPTSSINRIVRLRRPSEESVQQAVAACKQEGMSQGQASEKYQVSKTTVWRRLKKLKQTAGDKRSASDLEPSVKIEIVDRLEKDQLSQGCDEEVSGGELHCADSLDHQHSSLDPQHSSLDPQHSSLDPQDNSLDTQDNSLDPEHSSLDPQHSSLDPQHNSLDTQDNSLDPEHSSLAPQHNSLDPQDSRQKTYKYSGHHQHHPKSDGSSAVEGSTGHMVTETGGRQGGSLGVLAGEGREVVNRGGSLGLSDGSSSKVVEGTAGVAHHQAGSRMELEMPLMNLPGGGYQVVGSEIVIGGQQVVVLESSPHTVLESSPHTVLESSPHTVLESFPQMGGVEEVRKVDRTVDRVEAEGRPPAKYKNST